MLDSLRKAAGTWVAKLLLLMLGLSFAAWGITGQMAAGVGGNTVLSAGGTKVEVPQFRLAYDRQLRTLEQQFGQRLDRAQAKTFGVEEMTLANVVSGAVMDEQARKLGLGLSKDGVARMIGDDPAFKGPDGQVNRQQVEAVLQRIGMPTQVYITEQERAAIRQQLIQAIAGDMKTPTAYLSAMARHQGEDRTIDYLVLPASFIPAVEEPAQDVLAKWFEDNKKKFAAPEYRAFEYARLDPEDIADPTAITDKQIEDDYAARKAKFTTAETRTIEQLVFPNLEAANLALDQLRTGTTFVQLVQQSGKADSDIQLGTLTKDKVLDPAIAEAAFGLSLNQVSNVVQGAFGPVLVRVTAITPEVTKPLAEVRDSIRKELALGEANRVLMDSYSAYEDARAGGASLKEAAEKMKLKVVSIDAIDRTGKKPDGTIVSTLPMSDELLAGVFEATVKTENQPINTRENGYVFYEVTSVNAAHDRPLDEVKTQAIAAWKAEELAKRLETKAADFAKRVNEGATMDAIATEAAVEKQTKRGLKREADDPDIGRGGVAAAFDVIENQAGNFLGPDGASRVVFKVTEATEPLGADGTSLAADVKTNADRSLAGDLMDDYVARLRGEYDVQVNRAALERAMLN